MSSASGGWGEQDWNLSTAKFPDLKRPKVAAKKSEYAEYFIMANAIEGNDLKKASPFLIEKCLSTYVGDGTITKRLRDGQLLIKCKNEKQARQLMLMKTLGGQFNVKIEEHKSLNECKGLIYCYDLKFLAEEEILEGLSSQRVTEVRKIKKKVNGEYIDTALVVITFKLSSLPESIKVGFHHVPVKLYIPNPLRCLNCFKFGHPKKYCKSERVCALCSELFHENEECKTGTKCVNCKPPTNGHNNFNKDCERYKLEYEIQKIAITDKVSNFDARKKYKLIHPDFSYPTYANTLNGIALTQTNNQSKDTTITIQTNTTQSNKNQTESRTHAQTETNLKLNNTNKINSNSNSQQQEITDKADAYKRKFSKLALNNQIPPLPKETPSLLNASSLSEKDTHTPTLTLSKNQSTISSPPVEPMTI